MKKNGNRGVRRYAWQKKYQNNKRCVKKNGRYNVRKYIRKKCQRIIMNILERISEDYIQSIWEDKSDQEMSYISNN